jgi:hypothetical protein
LIENSLRFDKDADSTLTRSITTTGSQTKFTLSCWVKPSHDYDYTYLIGVSSSFSLYWTNTQKLHAEMYSSDGSSWAVISDTQAIFPDVAAWYHVVATVDSSAGTTNADRFKIWVNGVQQTIDFTTYWDGLITGPLRHLNESGQTHQINSRPGATYHSSFYLSEYHYLDGISVTSPTDFGEFDATTGIWTPIEYTGVHNAAQVGDGIVYSSGVSSPDGTIAAAPNDGTALFDGGITTNCQTTTAGTTVRWTPPTTVSWSTSLRVYTGPYSGSVVVRSNGTDYTLNTNGTQVASPYWLSHPNSSGTIDYIDAQGHIGAGVGYMKAIEVDGVILQDGAPAGVNGCYLNFSNSSNVGEDQAGSNDFTASGISAYGDATITTFEGNQTNPTTPVTSITGPDGYSHYAFFNLTNNSGQHIFYHQANNSTSTWFFSDSGHTYQATHSTQQGGNTLGYRSSTAEYENHVSTHGTFATANGTTSGYANDNPAGGISGGTVTGLNTTNAVNVWKFVVDMTNHKVWIDPGTGSYAGGGDPSNTSSTATFEIPDADLKFWSVPYASSSTNTIYSGSDTMKDSPMNGNPSTDTGLGGQLASNYATWNPLGGENDVIENGNLVAKSSSGYAQIASTIAMTSGKWYMEYTYTGDNSNGNYITFGVSQTNRSFSTGDGVTDEDTDYGFKCWDNGFYYQHNGANVHNYSDSISSGDVLSLAFDADLGRLWVAKNGTWMTNGNGLGDPANNSNPDINNLTYENGYFFMAGPYYDGSVSSILEGNFGAKAFQYQAPNGFKCLCTANLADSTITSGSDHMNVIARSGGGTTETLSFGADFVWSKRTDSTSDHYLFDSIRGGSNSVSSNTDGVENGVFTNPDYVTFNSDGYSISSSWDWGSSSTVIDYVWNAGTVSNPVGDVWEGGATKYIGVKFPTASGGTVSYGQKTGTTTVEVWTSSDNANWTQQGGTLTLGDGHTLTTTDQYVAIRNTSDATFENWYAAATNGADGHYSSVTYPSGATWSGPTYTDFDWRRDGGVLMTNSQGEVPSIVRGNSAAGFSIVEVDTPTNTEERPHGCGATPKFIIAKAIQDGAEPWHVYHGGTGYGKSHYGVLNRTQAMTAGDQWGTSDPNANYFYVKGLTGSGANDAAGMIYYIWADVPGYSRFDTFQSHLSDDVFVNLGFKPKLLWIKGGSHSSTYTSWMMYDSSQNSNNNYQNPLQANRQSAPGVRGDGVSTNNMPNLAVNFMSNGFQVTGLGEEVNYQGGSQPYRYIYCAWAEHPFKHSLAS